MDLLVRVSIWKKHIHIGFAYINIRDELGGTLAPKVDLFEYQKYTFSAFLSIKSNFAAPKAPRKFFDPLSTRYFRILSEYQNYIFSNFPKILSIKSTQNLGAP